MFGRPSRRKYPGSAHDRAARRPACPGATARWPAAAVRSRPVAAAARMAVGCGAGARPRWAARPTPRIATWKRPVCGASGRGDTAPASLRTRSRTEPGTVRGGGSADAYSLSGAGLHQSCGRRPRRPKERVLEDPRRPGGLPHKCLQHSRYWEDWGAVSEAALGYPARAHQRPEDDFLHRLCRRDSGVTAAIAQCQLPDGGGILVERLRVARARRLVELHLQTPTRFGILQLQFAIPRRRAVLDRPDLQQHQLVAEIRQKLQRPFAALVIQEI